MDSDIYSVAKGEYLEEIPSSHELLSEQYFSKTQGGSSSDIPPLVSAVRDLVEVISRQYENVSPTPDTFGVTEAARKLGCSPGFVRTLVRQGNLAHHRLGKNLRFRQADLEAYWSSQTRTGADKKKKVMGSSGQSDRRKIKTKHDDGEKPDSPRVFPSTKEIKKLWQ
jgi:excisionase family DNA binding protein